MHKWGMFYITFITIKQDRVSIKHSIIGHIIVRAEIAISPKKGEYKCGAQIPVCVYVCCGVEWNSIWHYSTLLCHAFI